MSAEAPTRPADIEDVTLAPLARPSKAFRLFATGLLVVIGLGIYAYSIQLRRGLSVTGMATTQDKVMWGLYITNFVFFIGISHAGTLISAILRLSHAGWRTPITRMAEFITVVALAVGVLFPIFDLGRPDRMLNVLRFGRWPSPILWDFFAIATYFVGSVMYLYLPMIPDLATCRDRLAGVVSRQREHMYRALSLGWKGTPKQRRSLASAIGLMCIIIIPVAITVHTVVSWIFAMTLRTGWNTAIFGIYFVGGAIFSGIATLIVVMAVLRRIYRLEDFITDRHFVNLGYLLAVFALVMMYFNISEFVTAGYKLEGSEPVYLGQIFTGSFAPLYWFYVVAGLIVPILLVTVRRTRHVRGIVTAAVLVDVAMWLERYIIVVASLKVPQMPYASPARYFPSWIEIAISLSALAFFALMIAVFTRFLPVMAMWEVREHATDTVTTEPIPSRVPSPEVIPS